MVDEKYYCTKGNCEYTRCIHCGEVWFGETNEKMPSGEGGEHGPFVVVLKPRMSYAEMGRILGISKQMAHKITMRALTKLRAHREEIEWRLR